MKGSNMIDGSNRAYQIGGDKDSAFKLFKLRDGLVALALLDVSRDEDRGPSFGAQCLAQTVCP